MAGLVKLGIRSGALDEVLALVRRRVEENRDTATDLVQDRSRWWIASTIDRRVAGMAVDGVLSLLDELRTQGSELRRGFETAFDGVVDTPRAEGALARAIAEGRRHLARSGASTAWRSASPRRCATASPPGSPPIPTPSPPRSPRCPRSRHPRSPPTTPPAPRSTPASPRWRRR